MMMRMIVVQWLAMGPAVLAGSLTVRRGLTVSEKCILGTNELTDNEEFRLALEKVADDIRTTEEYCQGLNAEKEGNSMEETKKNLFCVFDESKLASGAAYVEACEKAGGSIHQSDVLVTCNICTSSSETTQDDANLPRGKMAVSAAMMQQQQPATLPQGTTNGNQDGMMQMEMTEQELHATAEEATKETFEYEYLNMDFCFHPLACSQDDITKAIQEEANSLLDMMKESIEVLKSYSGTGSMSISCSATVLSEDGEMGETIVVPEEGSGEEGTTEEEEPQVEDPMDDLRMNETDIDGNSTELDSNETSTDDDLESLAVSRFGLVGASSSVIMALALAAMMW